MTTWLVAALFLLVGAATALALWQGVIRPLIMPLLRNRQ